VSVHPEEEIRREAAGVVRFDPARAAWLEARGYLRPRGPDADGARQVFYESRHRENARREDGPEGQVLFEKRASGLKNRDVRATRRSVDAQGSVLIREWVALRRALALGLRVPRPWAVGEVAGRLAPRAGFLLVEELPGRSLDDIVKAGGGLSLSKHKRLVSAVGQGVARLHDAGLTFAEMQAKHVWILDEESFEIGFLDLASVSFRSDPPLIERARDLGALAASLSHVQVSSPMRARMLQAYLDARRTRESRRGLFSAATLAASARYRLRRYRKNLATAWAGADDTPHIFQTQGGHDPAPESSTESDELVRGTEGEVQYEYLAFSLWHCFGIEARQPLSINRSSEREDSVVRFKATRQTRCPLAQALDGEADRAPILRALSELLMRTFRAGVLPEPGFLDHLEVTADERLVIRGRPPFRFPRRLRTHHVRRSMILLARALRRLPLPRDERKRLVSQLRREAPAAALVKPRLPRS